MKEYAVPTGRCTACGKLCFLSRKRAKRYMLQRFAKTNMTVYRCAGDPRYFHFGHTPYAVKRGYRPRGGELSLRHSA